MYPRKKLINWQFYTFAQHEKCLKGSTGGVGVSLFSMHRWGSRLQGSQFRSLLPNAANGESYEADCECLQDPKNSNQTENHSWNLKCNFITLEIQIQYGTSIYIYSLLYIYCHRLLQKKTKRTCLKLWKSKQKKPELPSHSTLRHSLRLHGSPRYPVEMTMTWFLCHRNACSQFRRLSAAAFFSSCWTFPGIENCWLTHMSNIHSRYVANESLCL